MAKTDATYRLADRRRVVLGSGATRLRRHGWLAWSPLCGLSAIALSVCGLSGCGQAVGDRSQPPAASPEVRLVQAVDGQDSPAVRVASANIGGGVHDHGSEAEAAAKESAPEWAASAIFYQIFPERFRNGDPTNDPTRESLEFPDLVSPNWAITPWGKDWYARADWEKEGGDNFFDNGVFDRRYGGDLQGVIDKLDYLQELGINALYLNPVFYARSMHKYDGNTYHHIDPYFGPDPEGDFEKMASETSDPETWQWTAADRLFLDLIKQAHSRGIRVIIDGVFNHTGRDFFAFQNLVEKQEDSPYRDWYIVQSFDNPDTPQNEFKYKGWWGVQTLPEFADNDAGDDLHPGPKEYIFDATAKWMDPDGDGDPSDGIDGWRLDVAAEVPNGFWSDWNAHCRELNPECYTVAEHWDDAAKFLAEGGFSATMNYHGFAFPMKGYLVDGTTSAGDAARELVARMNEFPSARRYALQNLMDSHDTDRLASMIVNAPNGRPYLQPGRSDYDVTERVSPRYWDGYDIRKPNDAEWRIQRLVALMQATFVGPPMIYYGTESGMWGADDPCDRMPMIWDDLEYEPQTADPLGRERPVDEVAFDQDLFDFYKAVFQLRSGSDALQTGDFEVLAADDSKGALAFKRSQEGETVYVFFNRGDESAELVVPIGDGEIEEIFTASGNPQGVQFDLQEGSLGVVLPAVEGVVLRETKTAE